MKKIVYYLTEDIYRRLVADGVDTPQKIELEIAIPRVWLTQYPMSTTLYNDDSFGLMDGGDGGIYAPGFGQSPGGEIKATHYTFPSQEKILSPSEYLDAAEGEIIRHTVEAVAELDRRRKMRGAEGEK